MGEDYHHPWHRRWQQVELGAVVVVAGHGPGQNEAVDVTAELVAPCGSEELFEWIADLGRYPQWLDIVPRAELADAHPDDPGPAWMVTLQGRLGPLARSKRLRMVRVACDEPISVRFERREHDGREHAPWVLMAAIAGADADGAVEEGESSTLQMQLHYGGSLGGGPVRSLLEDAIASSGPRLLACIAGEQA